MVSGGLLGFIQNGKFAVWNTFSNFGLSTSYILGDLLLRPARKPEVEVRRMVGSGLLGFVQIGRFAVLNKGLNLSLCLQPVASRRLHARAGEGIPRLSAIASKQGI
jgi:hypothetical protein